jgi:DNA-binding IclR family transcriptional regulator
MVLIDVSEHADSSIGEIAARTGFPQSHVSASVARLRELGTLAPGALGRLRTSTTRGRTG